MKDGAELEILGRKISGWPATAILIGFLLAIFFAGYGMGLMAR